MWEQLKQFYARICCACFLTGIENTNIWVCLSFFFIISRINQCNTEGKTNHDSKICFKEVVLCPLFAVRMATKKKIVFLFPCYFFYCVIIKNLLQHLLIYLYYFHLISVGYSFSMVYSSFFSQVFNAYFMHVILQLT